MIDYIFKTKIAQIYTEYANLESKKCIAKEKITIREYIKGYRLMFVIP